MEEDQLLDWSYFYQPKSTEELTESLLITTMELEATRLKAQEELKVKDDQLIQLKRLLNDAINERNEARNKYQTLLGHLRRQAPPYSAVSSVEDEPIVNGGFSSSDCEESIVSSPTVRFTPPAPVPVEKDMPFPAGALPEKGKLLEAVINAGPLLQNLLLAGPLPHWRHPPPPLDACRIPLPPVVVPTPAPTSHRVIGRFNKKRGFLEGSDSSTETKYQ